MTVISSFHHFIYLSKIICSVSRHSLNKLFLFRILVSLLWLLSRESSIYVIRRFPQIVRGTTEYTFAVHIGIDVNYYLFFALRSEKCCHVLLSICECIIRIHSEFTRHMTWFHK